MFAQSNFRLDFNKARYDDLNFPAADRAVLRDLAARVAEIAARPVMAERRDLWRRHNDLESTRPLILADPENGWKRPLIEIDESYVGDTKLTRKMEVSTTKSPETLGKDWLSCCALGGFNETECETIWDDEEIFGGRYWDLAS
jgi:hypothetical protein